MLAAATGAKVVRAAPAPTALPVLAVLLSGRLPFDADQLTERGAQIIVGAGALAVLPWELYEALVDRLALPDALALASTCRSLFWRLLVLSPRLVDAHGVTGPLDGAQLRLDYWRCLTRVYRLGLCAPMPLPNAPSCRLCRCPLLRTRSAASPALMRVECPGCMVAVNVPARFCCESTARHRLVPAMCAGCRVPICGSCPESAVCACERIPKLWCAACQPALLPSSSNGCLSCPRCASSKSEPREVICAVEAEGFEDHSAALPDQHSNWAVQLDRVVGQRLQAEQDERRARVERAMRPRSPDAPDARKAKKGRRGQPRKSLQDQLAEELEIELDL